MPRTVIKNTAQILVCTVLDDWFARDGDVSYEPPIVGLLDSNQRCVMDYGTTSPLTHDDRLYAVYQRNVFTARR